MTTRFKLCFVIPPMLLVAVGLALLARPMFPFRDGNSTDFWLAASRVKLEPESGADGGGFYPPGDGWVVYYLAYPGMIPLHGEVRYRVRLRDVVGDFDQVIERLNAAPEGSLRPYIAQAHKAWLARNLKDRDALTFLDEVHEAVLADYRETMPQLLDFHLGQEDYFSEQWERSKFYLLNLAFEFLFFNSLILFAFWPWLFNRRPWCWGVHVGLLPVMLLAPWFLGYASWTFTSVGPQGGVLYPWVIIPLTGLPVPWTSFDEYVVDSLPRILDPLNQLFSQPISCTGMGAPSPLFLLGLGCVFGLIAFGLRLGYLRCCRRGAVPE